MKAVVVQAANEPLVHVERDAPQPGPGELRVKVHACGICHSDHFVAQGLWPTLTLPRIPGHEVAGVVEAVGDGVTHFEPGDRVGIGWHGGHCGACNPCLAGHFIHCQTQGITGITLDGGYAEAIVAPAIAFARVPDDMDFATAAPLLCAGVTTYNALRHAGARPGDLVGIQGLGGLGHLGVQYAHAMGFEVVAISRGADKESFARDLGADHYVDTNAGEPAEQLQALGGAKAILATAPNAPAISALVGGLGIEGTLIVVGAPFDPLQIGAIDLISGDRSVRGWSSGTATDSTDALAFAQQTGVKPMLERYPLAEAQAGYDRMMSGKARFRVVLDVAQ